MTSSKDEPVKRSTRVREAIRDSGVSIKEILAAPGLSGEAALRSALGCDWEVDWGIDIPDIIALGNAIGPPFWAAINARCGQCNGSELSGGMTPESWKRAGERMKAARESLGLSVEEVSDHVGYYERWIRGIENGARIEGARYEAIRTLSASIELPIAAILGLSCRDCR